MKNRRNYYRILHVQPDAPTEIIKSSYRTLLLRLGKHPDHGGEPADAALINEAREVLTDPRKRAEYDRQFFASRQPAGQGRMARARAEQQGIVPQQETAERSCRACVRCLFCQHLQPLTNGGGMPVNCSRCRSPLQPAEKARLLHASRRSVNRIAKYFPMTFFTQWPAGHGHQAVVEEVSPKGMRFCADQPLARGQIIAIQSCYLNAVAQVVYCLADAAGQTTHQKVCIGVEFLTLQFLITSGMFLSTTI